MNTALATAHPALSEVLAVHMPQGLDEPRQIEDYLRLAVFRSYDDPKPRDAGWGLITAAAYWGDRDDIDTEVIGQTYGAASELFLTNLTAADRYSYRIQDKAAYLGLPLARALFDRHVTVAEVRREAESAQIAMNGLVAEGYQRVNEIDGNSIAKRPTLERGYLFEAMMMAFFLGDDSLNRRNIFPAFAPLVLESNTEKNIDIMFIKKEDGSPAQFLGGVDCKSSVPKKKASRNEVPGYRAVVIPKDLVQAHDKSKTSDEIMEEWLKYNVHSQRVMHTYMHLRLSTVLPAVSAIAPPR